MIKKLVLLLVFLVLHIVVVQSISNILYTPCSTNGTLINYSINSNDIANFSTLDYPKSLIDNGTAAFCQARFYTIIENQRIWMTLYNGYTGNFIAFDDEFNQFGRSFDSTNGITSFSSQTQSLTFKLNTLESSDWVAFQAVVIAYDPEIAQCPFSGQTINFRNSEILIIPIASDFGQKNSGTNCQWTFRTNYGTYLKIVVQSLILDENVIFELKQNGTTIKRFDKNISEPEVYYFSADLGNLILYYSDTNDAIFGTGFSALVSEAIVPSSSLTKECPSMMKDNVLTVWNLDYEFGYKANQKCEYSIEVKENQEVFVEVTTFHIEKNVDKLSVIFEEFNYPIDNQDSDNVFQLAPSANNSLIRFEADSNVQQAGFEVALRAFDCSCQDKDIIISCSDSVEITPLGINELYYCDNMNCRYHISSDPTCSSELSEDIYELYLSAEIREGYDYFNIYADGILREKLDKSMIYQRYFPRELNISLEFISTSDSPIKNGDQKWVLKLNNKKSPPIFSVTLNESEPLYAVDIFGINEFDIISVCAPETDVLELIIASNKTLLQNYVLFDGSDYIGKLDSPEIFDEDSQNFGQISSKTGCFTIQKTAEDLLRETGIFLFRMKNAQSKNCINENNIKILSFENTSFENAANFEGDCEMIILSPRSLFQFSIDSMSGTPNNIFTLKSPMNQNIFAEINSTELSLWKNLQLYTPALSVILPPSTFFNMFAKFGSDGIIKAEMDSQKGIMASPSYSNPNFLVDSWSSDPLFSIVPIDSSSFVTADLELQSKEGNNSVLIKIDFDSTDYYLKYAGDKLTVNGTRIHIEQHSHNDKFLISYTLTLNPTQSSSTILTTTLNPSNPPTTVNPTDLPSTNPSITTSNPNTSTTTSYSNTSITTNIPIPTTPGSSANRILSSFLLFLFSLSFIAFYF